MFLVMRVILKVPISKSNSIPLFFLPAYVGFVYVMAKTVNGKTCPENKASKFSPSYASLLWGTFSIPKKAQCIFRKKTRFYTTSNLIFYGTFNLEK
jgi:hypothetical protein